MGKQNKENNEIKSIISRVSLLDYIKRKEPEYTIINVFDKSIKFLNKPIKCFRSNNNSELNIVGFINDLGIMFKQNQSEHFELETIKLSHCYINVQCVLLSDLKNSDVKFVEQLSFLTE